MEKFDSQGTFLTAWGTPGSGDGQFSSPTGIAVDPAGNVYVGEYGNNHVQKFALQAAVLPLPGITNAPTDPDHDGLYEDLNGNGEAGFSDVVQFFKNIDWIAENEPVSAFDFTGNGGIGFSDIVALFKEL